MAKINFIVENQNFEIIRDRIAAILFTELRNQFNLSNNQELNCDVFVERKTPVDKVEIPTVIVSYVSGDYDNKTAISVRGSYSYNIDIFTSSTTTTASDGAVRSTLNLHRLLGICRYILDNPHYKTLDFTPGFIAHVAVNSMNIASIKSNDADNTAMGRIVLNVVANECNGYQESCELNDYYSSVLINTSEQGYVYLTEKTDD